MKIINNFKNSPLAAKILTLFSMAIILVILTLILIIAPEIIIVIFLGIAAIVIFLGIIFALYLTKELFVYVFGDKGHPDNFWFGVFYKK